MKGNADRRDKIRGVEVLKGASYMEHLQVINGKLSIRDIVTNQESRSDSRTVEITLNDVRIQLCEHVCVAITPVSCGVSCC